MKEKILKFLKGKSAEINEIAEYYPERKSLVIDYQELWKFDRKLADELQNNPDEIVRLFEESLGEMNVQTVVENPRFHVRFRNLPKEKGYNVMVRNITSDYIGKFLSVEGVVNRISDVLPKVIEGLFICNRCGQEKWVTQDKRMLQEPQLCDHCRKKDFRFVPEKSKFIDSQHLEIQEPLEFLKGGEQARRIKIWVEDDITDVVTMGDKVVVTGVVRLQPPKFKGAVYDRFIEASHVEGVERAFEDIKITKEEEKRIKKLAKDPKIHEKIINCIAPSIYGYREVKEAIALQLFGGRQGKKAPEGTPMRADIHVLLVGDPGVAKSKMLQYVDQIAPKSIYVTGKGTTGAGLTATAEKDEFADGAWTLRAGALVLAGDGIVAIDEFDKMDKEDRGAMHEAMEQQTISVAKAGIVTKFKANTSVLAAANPKLGRFDKFKPLPDQFDIPPTLVSRFDLIFPIRDVRDKETDRKIAEHMLKMHVMAEGVGEMEPEIPAELFQKYIAYARIHIKPALTDEAAEKIKEYYVNLRASSVETVAATPRQLDALVRLSEASAKIRFSDEVTVDDADRAIVLTDFVLREIAYDEKTGKLDIDRVVTYFPSATRVQINIVQEIIAKLAAVDKNGASFDEIVNKAEERGIDKSNAEEYIKTLKTKGSIYEVKMGRYLPVE